MKKFKIKAVDNSSPTWTGEYTTIERTNNPFSVGYEDIKVYALDDDDEEFLSLELTAYHVESIDYDYDDFEDEDDDAADDEDSHRFIDFWSLVIGIAVGAFLVWVNLKK